MKEKELEKLRPGDTILFGSSGLSQGVKLIEREMNQVVRVHTTRSLLGRQDLLNVNVRVRKKERG